MVSELETLVRSRFSLVLHCNVENYGFDIDTDRVSNRAYVRNLDDKSSASKMFSSTKAARNANKGTYVVSVDGKPTFTVADVIGCVRRLQADEIKSFEIVFAPEKRLTDAEQRRVDEEHCWFTPNGVPVQYVDAGTNRDQTKLVSSV